LAAHFEARNLNHLLPQKVDGGLFTSGSPWQAVSEQAFVIALVLKHKSL
jgi:hypothetical protein